MIYSRNGRSMVSIWRFNNSLTVIKQRRWRLLNRRLSGRQMEATLTKTCHKCGHKNKIPVELGFNWRDMFCQKCGSYIGVIHNSYQNNAIWNN